MDAADVARVLRVLGIEGLTASRLLAENFEKSVWRVDTTEGRFALRMLRPRDADAADREIAILAAARAAGVSVSALRARGPVEAPPVLLRSWAEGQTLAVAARARPCLLFRPGLA